MSFSAAIIYTEYQRRCSITEKRYIFIMKKVISIITAMLSSLFLTISVSAESSSVRLTEENKVSLFICLIIAIIGGFAIVNGAYRLYMKITDSDMMFYSKKKKMIAVLVVSIILFGLLAKVVGIY